MNTKNSEILEVIEQFSEKLPKFPDGRIDYSNSDIAPVITVFVKVDDELLLLKRSDKVRTYKGEWNTVAGYLDEIRPVKEKVLEELKEEVGINRELIFKVSIKDYYEFKDTKIDKTWIITPVLVELKEKPEIKLDWEHSEYKWVKEEELERFNIVADLKNTFKKALKA